MMPEQADQERVNEAEAANSARRAHIFYQLVPVLEMEMVEIGY